MKNLFLLLMLASLGLIALMRPEPSRPELSGAQPGTATATFAGGCFWCMEPSFEKLGGVLRVESGYIGGCGENPTYEDYAKKGHVEAVQITYDPAKINYVQLLDVLWRQINPTDSGGQFVDRGAQYRSAIFYHDEEQKRLAEASKAQFAQSCRFTQPIVTEILPAGAFYKAEDYHQDFYKKHSIKYRYYRHRSGRDQFLEKTWGRDAVMNTSHENTQAGGKPTKEELKRRLTPLQYNVTQEDGTEPAHQNEYWNNKRPGIYVDIVSGEPLFRSLDMFDSGTGWPSFTRPLAPENVVEKEDRGWFTVRTEVRSRGADSHLGHVFNDGPPPTGQRYCMNSAALRFIPLEDLEKEGYGRYRGLFAKS